MVVNRNFHRMRLRAAWSSSSRRGAVISDSAANSEAVLQTVFTAEQIAQIDLFDQAQLATVVETCRTSASLSEAGRQLFAVSRQKKKNTNDADRLRKYLVRFGLTWQECREGSDRRSQRHIL